MRTVLAAAAAGALIMGSAAGAMAAKPVTSPQKNDRVVSVSIKGHSPIDLKTASAETAIKLRAKLWDPKRDSAATTMKVTLGVYTKKVGGDVFNLATPPAPAAAAPMSEEVTLILNPADEKKKVKRYALDAKVLDQLWSGAQLTTLAGALDSNEKAYICISNLTVTPTTKYSMQVNKRLGLAKGKPVRDCVKVIDSTTP